MFLLFAGTSSSYYLLAHQVIVMLSFEDHIACL
jgi:hypothetical protein